MPHNLRMMHASHPSMDRSAASSIRSRDFGVMRFARFLSGGLQPSGEATRVDAQAAAHRRHRKQQSIVDNRRVLHFASLAKYAVVVFKISRPRKPWPAHASAASFRTPSRPGRRLRTVLLPCIERVLAHAQGLRYVRHRIAPFGELGHRIRL